MEITLPGRPFRYGNVVFRQPFRGSTHKLTVTDETITLAWAYNPEFGQKGYVAAIRLIRRGGSLKAFEKRYQPDRRGQPYRCQQHRKI